MRTVVQITQIPGGDTPMWIKQEWLGCIVPVEASGTFTGFGIMVCEVQPSIDCYVVRKEAAIQALEASLSRPVLTANQVTFWQGLRVVGITASISDYGRLFRRAAQQ